MGRRSAGLLVVAVVLLAVVALAQVNHETYVAGFGAAEPVAGPPQPGDCLLEKPPVGGGWGYQGPLYPPLRVGRCQGSRWGEVVSVVAGGLTAPTSVTTTDAYGSDITENPVQTRCTQAQTVYLSAGRPAFEDWLHWDWQMGYLAVVGPTVRQRSAGQSWLACVLTADSGPTATAYQGALKGVTFDGRLPVSFAMCAATVQDVQSGLSGQIPMPLIPCAVDHQVEIFSRNTYLPAVTQAQLDSSCAGLARWLTRMPEVTAGGALTTRAVASHPDATTGSPVAGVGGNGVAACLIDAVGNRKLKGSLVGLGAGAIPWSE